MSHLEHRSGVGETGKPQGPSGFGGESHGFPAGSGDTLMGSPRARGVSRRRARSEQIRVGNYMWTAV